jgi:hypothetical protein
MGLSRLLGSLFDRLPVPAGEDGPQPIDAAFRELPPAEWTKRATIALLEMRGNLDPVSQARRDPADRVAALADLPPAQRSEQLRGLVEEERALSRRGEFFGSGSGRA